MVRRDRPKLDLATCMRRFRVSAGSVECGVADPIAGPNGG
jgi:hypothetical protein